VAVLHGRRSQAANLIHHGICYKEASCRGARLGSPAPESKFGNGSEPASTCYGSRGNSDSVVTTLPDAQRLKTRDADRGRHSHLMDGGSVGSGNSRTWRCRDRQAH
jgi:hypothetical protein